MGEFFRSFEQAWSYFLHRQEPLENYYDQLPEDEETRLAGWLLRVEPVLAPAFERVQEQLALPWLRPVPAHWLHVWIEGGTWLGRDPGPLVEQAREALAGVEPFRISFPRLTCFHNGVVAEVDSDRPRELAARLLPGRDLSTFLPHVTVAIVTEEAPAEPLRRLLAPIRETSLGEQEVRAVDLCLVPASQTTVLDPWTVAGSVELA
jgi:2'-5' RNA ligase